MTTVARCRLMSILSAGKRSGWALWQYRQPPRCPPDRDLPVAEGSHGDGGQPAVAIADRINQGMQSLVETLYAVSGIVVFGRGASIGIFFIFRSR